MGLDHKPETVGSCRGSSRNSIDVPGGGGGSFSIICRVGGLSIQLC